MSDRARETSAETESLPHQPDSGSSSFLHRPLAVVTLISGIVASITAIVTLAINILDDNEPSGGPGDERVTPGAAVEQCVTDHGLSSASQKDVGQTGAVLFRRCTWPPPSGAEADGYSEISISSRDGPGQSEAEGLTVADYVDSTCRNVRLVYLFDNQGTFEPEEPILLSKGEIRRVEGGSVWQPRNEEEANSFSPGRDQSIVMSNSRYMVESARCV